MKKPIFKLSVLALIATTVTVCMVSSCKKEETTVTPAPPGNEFLTTVKLTCINSTNADTSTGIWKDLTPDDANPPDTSKAILNLKKNALYHMSIAILDETKTPAGDIGADILARANYHLFCFNVSSSLGSNLTVKRTDHDTNKPALELGLKDDLTTINVSNGVLEVVLHHQPNVKDGTCDKGSVDMDVNFHVNIIP